MHVNISSLLACMLEYFQRRMDRIAIFYDEGDSEVYFADKSGYSFSPMSRAAPSDVTCNHKHTIAVS